ncbi:MAG: bacterio-opsin activator domain-containing protein [Halorientalis sp.]
MAATESIHSAALDTLSSQVAVLDEDGTILFTNSAWGSVDASSETPDAEGQNYFDSVDPRADEYAVDAVRGIRAVVAGREDVFELEYPCHSDDEKRWFLMRATPFSVAGEDYVTVTHIDITDRRLAELDARAHAEQAERERERLEHLLARINGLVQDVTTLLVEARSRSEIEQGVCDRVVAADPYVHAWVASPDLAAETLSVRASAGSGAVALDDATFSLSGNRDDPTVSAYREEAVTVVEQIEPDSRLGRLYGDAGVESLIAVPVADRDRSYGVLTVSAARADAFDERERVVLEALGRAIANTLDALESKRTLTADQVVEVEVTLADDAVLVSRLSDRTGARLTYSGSAYTDDGGTRVFYRVADADPESVVAAAADAGDVSEARVVATTGEEAVVQFTRPSSLVTAMADAGAVTRELVVEDGVARLTLELPQEADVRALFATLEDRYDSTELVGYHEHERPVQTREEFRAGLEESLTDRQLTALRTAYFSGFFDWPRRADGDDLAAMMDISRSTFHQHLRVAERKVLAAFFDRT